MLEIYLASDHAGAQLRQAIAAHLADTAMLHDLGADGAEKVDYPITRQNWHEICNPSRRVSVC